MQQRHVWSLSPHEALVYAKMELQNTPAVANDPDLYAPIFKNVSMFKRYVMLLAITISIF